MAEEIKILRVAGSMRKSSYNKAVLRAAADLVPAGAALEIFDLEGIPPFNQDLEQAMPDMPKEFKAKVRQADAILFVTPENNYSVPGVLSNAIAWAKKLQ